MTKKFWKIAALSFVLASGAFVSSCAGDGEEIDLSQTEINRPLGKELDVYWRLVENYYKGGSTYLTEFTIENNSDKSLQPNWTIYFHQPRFIKSDKVSENVKITHINGDYYKVEPQDSFPVLKAGEAATFSYESEWWAIKMVDAPNGLYVTFTDTAGVVTAPELLENVTYHPMTELKQTNRMEDDPLPVPTATSRFDRNASVNFVGKEGLVKIMPTPVSYEETSGVFEIQSGVKIAYSKTLQAEAQFLADKLQEDLNVKAELVEGTEGAIVLKTGDVKVANKDTEAYFLTVTEKGVEVEGSDAAGVFYGVQSLRSLVQASDLIAKNGAKIQAVQVQDAPRFGYRGLHLDVVRNFQTKESVLRMLDIMAFYKLNKFHFHITDDEGWRIEIPGLPELTEVGSKRGHTADESDMLNPAYGSGPFPTVEAFGSGYYSKADFIEILKYAKARHIEVIPELDFPGHARAAIVSMKARQKRLIEAGKEAEANEYLLHDENDASRYRSVQYYDDNVLCVCQESTYNFLSKVVDEVVNMYQEAEAPITTVHIGGDEVPHPTADDPNHGAWRESPKCKNYLATSKEYQKPEELFYYFVDRFSDILAEKNLTTAGWEEIGLKKGEDEEGEMLVETNEKFKEKGFVPYIWNTVWGWGAEDRGYKLANDGYKVVLSNVNNMYFDLSYDKDPFDPGYYWGGLVDTRTSWGMVPLDMYKAELVNNLGAPVKESYYKDHVRLTPEGKANVLGIQGQLWAETVKGRDMMEYYLFPKMLGLVERAWAQDPSWSAIESQDERFAALSVNWGEFASRLGYFELPRIAVLNGGYNYRIEPAGAKLVDGKLTINSKYPGFVFRYTTDGSEPTSESAVYTEPVAVTGTEVKVVAFDAAGNKSRVSVLKVN